MITNELLINELNAAIRRSRSQNETILVEVDSVDEALAALHEIYDGETDHVSGVTVSERDVTDVWGWTDEQSEGEHDWRLHLAVA